MQKNRLGPVSSIDPLTVSFEPGYDHAIMLNLDIYRDTHGRTITVQRFHKLVKPS